MKVKALTARLTARLLPAWSDMDDGERYVATLGAILIVLHPVGLIMGLTGNGWGVLYTALIWDAVVVVCLGAAHLMIWRERRAIERRRATARAWLQEMVDSTDQERP